MLKIQILLFWEFLKIGIFAIGGGYSAIPFLFYMQSQYNWYTVDELTNMIAIANITPGPVGINMATYAGYKVSGVMGAVLSTIAIILVPFIIAVVITKLFTKFHDNKGVKNIFVGLKAAVCALLTYIAIKLLLQTISFEGIENFDLKTLIVFVMILVPFSFFDKNPVLTIITGAFLGITILK